MKFIVDAQLPVVLKYFLIRAGFDTIHTDDFPDKERTTDNQIREISIKENRIVISKDSDFVDSFYIRGFPKKLLLVSTGNIKNKELITLFFENISQISDLFSNCEFVEMTNSEIICH